MIFIVSNISCDLLKADAYRTILLSLLKDVISTDKLDVVQYHIKFIYRNDMVGKTYEDVCDLSIIYAPNVLQYLRTSRF